MALSNQSSIESHEVLSIGHILQYHYYITHQANEPLNTYKQTI